MSGVAGRDVAEWSNALALGLGWMGEGIGGRGVA